MLCRGGSQDWPQAISQWGMLAGRIQPQVRPPVWQPGRPGGRAAHRLPSCPRGTGATMLQQFARLCRPLGLAFRRSTTQFMHQIPEIMQQVTHL